MLNCSTQQYHWLIMACLVCTLNLHCSHTYGTWHNIRCSCRKCWTTFSLSLVANSHFTHWNILPRREEEVEPTASVNTMKTAIHKGTGEYSHPTWGTGGLKQEELPPVHAQIKDRRESLCLCK